MPTVSKELPWITATTDAGQCSPLSLIGAEEAANGAAREEACPCGTHYRTGDPWTGGEALMATADPPAVQNTLPSLSCRRKLLTQLGWSCQNPERRALSGTRPSPDGNGPARRI